MDFACKYADRIHATSPGQTNRVGKNVTLGPFFFDFSKTQPANDINSSALKAVFDKYASVQINGENYMTAEDLIVKYLKLLPENQYHERYIQTIYNVIGLEHRDERHISFDDFKVIEARIRRPDTICKIAFKLFDTNNNGFVSYDDFLTGLTKTSLFQRSFFASENSTHLELYFGSEPKRKSLSYAEFSQFIFDCKDHYAAAEFSARDHKNNGYISVSDFEDLIVQTKDHLLSDLVRSNIKSIAQDQRVSYPYFTGFVSLLSNIELIKNVFSNVTNGSAIKELSKEDFLQSTQFISQITPLQVDILFGIFKLINQNGRMTFSGVEAITPEKRIENLASTHVSSKQMKNGGLLTQLLQSSYRFALGAIAGAMGAGVVYPIDLIKTRMQNQRRTEAYSSGETMYKHGFDCFKKVLRHEGIHGLYRGLIPQLMGVAPEKAIKLTVNDLMRDKICQYNQQKISLFGEILAGGLAGVSQVMFTNPVEIVKIRLQVAGEITSVPQLSTFSIVKQLGFFGLYKGATACILRDAPFSAIYFPAYAHLKPKFADAQGHNSPLSLLLAGGIAGIPAASLVTPADVIKTRLQVVAREGQSTYNGVFDAALKIYAEEGFRAFWKGSIARMCRSSPQFGVTLVTYELLQRTFNLDFVTDQPVKEETNCSKSSGCANKEINSEHVGGFKLARPILCGIDTKFGLLLPKFQSSFDSSIKDAHK